MAVMPDAVVEVEINQTWRTAIAIAVLLFNGAVIAMVTWKGDPANSLHQSALTWSYASGLGVLAGLGFGALAQYLPSIAFKR